MNGEVTSLASTMTDTVWTTVVRFSSLPRPYQLSEPTKVISNDC